jgi:hypothetical protein
LHPIPKRYLRDGEKDIEQALGFSERMLARRARFDELRPAPSSAVFLKLGLTQTRMREQPCHRAKHLVRTLFA